MEQQTMQPPPPGPEKRHGRHHWPDERPKQSTGRVVAYYLVLIVLNVLLAVYALYMLGYALAFDWSVLKTGGLQAILESALQLLLLFSPVILTILINRLLYRAFRGWKRFPRGTWFFALLAILVVQAATVMVIFGYGYVDGVNGLNIESTGILPPG